MSDIATKNGSIIVKDGSVAQNCNCCGGWYCYNAQCECPYPTNANGARYLPIATTLFDGIRSFSANQEFSNLPYWHYDSYGMENQTATVTNTTIENLGGWVVVSFWYRQLDNIDQPQYPYPFPFQRKHYEPCCGSTVVSQASIVVTMFCRQSYWSISWVTDAWCSKWGGADLGVLGYAFDSRCYGEGQFAVGKRDSGLPVAGTYPLIDSRYPCNDCVSFIKNATLTIH